MKTLQVRVKDKHAAVLRDMARQVNQVFNFCNETSMKAIRDRRQFLSGFDLQKLVTGYSQCDGVTIRQDTANIICASDPCSSDFWWRAMNRSAIVRAAASLATAAKGEQA